MIKHTDVVDHVHAAGQPDWKRVALSQIAERLTPPSDFPCVFSQSAYRAWRRCSSGAPRPRPP